MANTDERYIIYDIETYCNLSTFCFLDYASKKKKQFVIHQSRNELDELYKFLRSTQVHKYYLVGFNNLAFDSQVIQFILATYEMLKGLTGDTISNLIYQKAQEVITVPEKERFNILIPESRLSIMQIDLYKQKHYDGKAKRTSLKWLEFTMNFPNIEEMPLPHYEEVSEEDVERVLEYNWNDVNATHEFFERMKFETVLRLKLSEQYQLPLLNASEPRMAREILASLLAKDMGISVKELKDKRTFRKEIHLGKCILPIVKFKDEKFKELVAQLKKTIINANSIKGAFVHSINYKGIDIEYGVGGIHGAVPSGVYMSDDEYVIKTVDVKSYYPNMIINYGFAPAHLGETFANRYKWFYTERNKYNKKDPINYIFKIILNSVYGLSNDINSFLYDTLTTMKTTINGQLLLSMLAESLSDIPSSKLLMLNTDGLEIRIPRSESENFEKRCKDWEKITNLELEYEEYERMIIGDVNNYIAVFSKKAAKSEQDYIQLQKDEPNYIYSDPESLEYNIVKAKGRFELKLDYHKNPSGIVISRAIYDYFCKGVLPEESILGAKNLFDFCYGIKKKSDFEIVLHSVKKGEHIREKQQKVCRFYISKNGGKLVKEYSKGGITSVNASALVKPCNRIYENIIPDDLDRDYYIKECYKEIHGIEGEKSNQLLLF